MGDQGQYSQIKSSGNRWFAKIGAAIAQKAKKAV